MACYGTKKNLLTKTILLSTYNKRVLFIYQNIQFYSIAKVIFEEQSSIFCTNHLHSSLQISEHNNNNNNNNNKKKIISQPKLML